jgi:hypothetical protein
MKPNTAPSNDKNKQTLDAIIATIQANLQPAETIILSGVSPQVSVLIPAAAGASDDDVAEDVADLLSPGVSIILSFPHIESEDPGIRQIK